MLLKLTIWLLASAIILLIALAIVHAALRSWPQALGSFALAMLCARAFRSATGLLAANY